VVYCWDPAASGGRHFLLYSILLLRKHLPWHRGRIVVVSQDGELPHNLEAAALRVTAVAHQCMMPAAYLGRQTCRPTVVESCLHRIPGLTDTFLYMREDQFFLQDAAPQQFLRQGRHTFFRSQHHTLQDLQDRQQRRPATAYHVQRHRTLRTGRLAQRRWGTPLAAMGTPQPLPLALRRDVLREVCSTFQPEMDAMAAPGARPEMDVLPTLLAQEWWRACAPENARWSCHNHLFCEELTLRNLARIAVALRQEDGSHIVCLDATKDPNQLVLRMVQRIFDSIAHQFPFATAR
jgi:hypothetical protein